MNTDTEKPPQLTREMLEAYRARWELVAERERQEQREATVTQRWQKLNTLFGMARELNLSIDKDDEQLEIIWARWNRLRHLYLASQQERQSHECAG